MIVLMSFIFSLRGFKSHVRLLSHSPGLFCFPFCPAANVAVLTFFVFALVFRCCALLVRYRIVLYVASIVVVFYFLFLSVK